MFHRSCRNFALGVFQLSQRAGKRAEGGKGAPEHRFGSLKVVPKAALACHVSRMLEAPNLSKHAFRMGEVPKSRKRKFPWTDFQSHCDFCMTQLAIRAEAHNRMCFAGPTCFSQLVLIVQTCSSARLFGPGASNLVSGLAKAAIPLERGVEIAKPHFPKQSIEKRSLQAPR